MSSRVSSCGQGHQHKNRQPNVHTNPKCSSFDTDQNNLRYSAEMIFAMLSWIKVGIMNQILRVRIERVRDALAFDSDGVLVGSLPLPEAEVRTALSGYPSDYVELMEVSNGIQCGEVVLYSRASLDRYRSLAELIPGGTTEWLIIGYFSIRDLALSWRTGELHLINIRDSESTDEIYPRLDSFLNCMFGPEYLRLAGEPDDWYRLLVRLGFAPVV
jgi:hypothetical protein